LDLRQRLLALTDRALAVLLAVLLAGTTLAFGGETWWAAPAIAVLTAAIVLASLVRVVLVGRMPVLKSPLVFLGLLALGLAAVQLAPLPGPVAGRISPRSREVYALGALSRPVLAADPTIALPEPAGIRSPVTVDRSATLRWLAGATACLALFWGVSQFADRLGRLYVVWGSIVAAFILNTAIAVVQLIGGSGGLYGFIEPGKGPSWAPSAHDLLTSPNAAALRTVAEGGGEHPPWASLRPDRPFFIGSLMGGPGAYLALGSIGLPLSLALLLQLMAPRGSREGFWARLGETGQGGLVVLLAGMLAIGAGVVGLLAGPALAVPFAIALMMVGLPSAWPSGLRWSGLALTALSLAGLASGVALGALLSRMPGAAGLPVAAGGWGAAARVWADARAIVADFPVFGAGLGSFAAIYPSYKATDAATTTALSSLVQWWVEAGAAGLALLMAAAAWCLVRLPGAVRRVGTADRALAFGLIGAAAGFSLFSVVHWTIELAAVAIAASALGGACDRWLAGGTDLFVERG
jgi:hypothetical protein